jgi:hypothetical protein
MLNFAEQAEIADLAKRWVHAELRASRLQNAEMPSSSPKTARQTVRVARQRFKDALKEMG